MVPPRTDATPAPTPGAYPDELTEIEKVEIASALGFHFGQCQGDPLYGLETQYEIVCAVVERMIRRRAGLI